MRGSSSICATRLTAPIPNTCRWSLRASPAAPFGNRSRPTCAAGSGSSGADWPLLEFGLYHEQVALPATDSRAPRFTFPCMKSWSTRREPSCGTCSHFCGVDPDLHRRPVLTPPRTPSVPRMAGGVYFLKKWGVWPQLRRLAPRALRPWLRSVLLRPRASSHRSRHDRAFLADYYRDDINRLATLLNRDLSGWLQTTAGQHRRSDGKVSDASTIHFIGSAGLEPALLETRR